MVIVSIIINSIIASIIISSMITCTYTLYEGGAGDGHPRGQHRGASGGIN